MENIVSLLRPRVISSGISVCRLKNGSIAISMHEENKRLLLEVSEDEARRFADDLMDFLAGVRSCAERQGRRPTANGPHGREGVMAQ